MDVRQVTEGDSIYYIGEVSVDNQETLRYELDVTPAGTTEPLRLSFMRKFYTD